MSEMEEITDKLREIAELFKIENELRDETENTKDMRDIVQIVNVHRKNMMKGFVTEYYGIVDAAEKTREKMPRSEKRKLLRTYFSHSKD